MSNYQYETDPHHCPNAKDPTAHHVAIDPHTVVKVGYILDPDLSEVVGYRKQGTMLRTMGDICQDGNLLSGEEITRFEFNRTKELFLIGFEVGEVPGVASIQVTLPSGANFGAIFNATYNAYVYPYPGGSKEFDFSGVTMTVNLEPVAP